MGNIRVYLDTEFIEKKGNMQLISIGLYAPKQEGLSEGREYYAISKDFNPNDADPWVWDNVIVKLDSKSTWKQQAVIAWEVVNFIADLFELQVMQGGNGNMFFDPKKGTYVDSNLDIEFWADYCAYDWVLFCSLFGSMVDLPRGLPMYCNDLQQLLKMTKATKTGMLAQKPETLHIAIEDAKWDYDFHRHIENYWIPDNEIPVQSVRPDFH